jgi:hypothetical protein
LWQTYQLENFSPFSDVFWLQAGTETDLRIAYLEVMERLKIELTPDETDLTVSELAGRIWQRLGVLSSSKLEFLVVFDNIPEEEVADGYEDAREAFKACFVLLPASNWGQVQILLTSRLFSLRGPDTPLGYVHPHVVGRLEEVPAVCS